MSFSQRASKNEIFIAIQCPCHVHARAFLRLSALVAAMLGAVLGSGCLFGPFVSSKCFPWRPKLCWQPSLSFFLTTVPISEVGSHLELLRLASGLMRFQSCTCSRGSGWLFPFLLCSSIRSWSVLPFVAMLGNGCCVVRPGGTMLYRTWRSGLLETAEGHWQERPIESAGMLQRGGG